MNIGKKIQILRKFRGLTQAELGIALGFKPEAAANRITQYETSYRVPKEDALTQMAEVLKVSKYNFIETDDTACDFILTLFWLDPLEEGEPLIVPWLLHGQEDDSRGMSILPRWAALTTAFYNENSEMPRPFIELRDDSINSYLAEWNRIRTYLSEEKISKNEYLDWKFNWYERKCDPDRRIKYTMSEMFQKQQTVLQQYFEKK